MGSMARLILSTTSTAVSPFSLLAPMVLKTLASQNSSRVYGRLCRLEFGGGHPRCKADRAEEGRMPPKSKAVGGYAVRITGASTFDSSRAAPAAAFA